MNSIRITAVATLFLLSLQSLTYAQMQRERVEQNEPEEMFWSTQLMGLESAEQLQQGNLNVTVMHTFGLATKNVVNDFFGLDFSPNVRLGLDYGLTDRWSLGIGRSSMEDVVDLRTKIALLRQRSSSPPFSLSLKADAGVTTATNGFSFRERLSYLGEVIIARKVSDGLTLQLTPLYSYFNTVTEDEVSGHFAVGTAAEYHFNRRLAGMVEYIPVIGDRSPGTKNAFTAGLNIETGGHVFQLYLSSAQWHTEQYVVARNRDAFWAGDFRFGFNINRLFGIGSN